MRLLPSSGVFARAELTDDVDLERLRALLRGAPGPAWLAEDPAAYAQEWLRLDELEAERPPLVPERVWSWCRRKFRAQERDPRSQISDERRLRVQWLDEQGRRMRVAFLVSPEGAWASELITERQTSRYLGLAQIEDVRELADLSSAARAARREWGHEGGFAEWTPRHGARRFPGDILRAVDD